jgi:hypothetical protein
MVTYLQRWAGPHSDGSGSEALDDMDLMDDEVGPDKSVDDSEKGK